MSAISSAVGSALMSVSQKNSGPARADQHVHGRRRPDPFAQTDDVQHIFDMIGIAADQSAQQGVAVAETQQQRPDHRGAGVDPDAGFVGIDPVASAQLVVFLPALLVVGLFWGSITSNPARDGCAAQFGDALFDPPAPPNEDRFGQDRRR
jgi:hypothetical protein